MFKFGFRDKVKDTITGFTGIVTGRTEWLNGCIRYGIQPTKLKDGLPVECQHIDEEQLELVSRPKKKVKSTPSGGPQNDPNLNNMNVR